MPDWHRYRKLRFRFTAVLAVMVAGAIGAGVLEGWFLAHAAHAQGTVVSVETSSSGGLKGSRGTPEYRPTISFADKGGRAWTFTSGRFGLEGGKVGTSLPVVYDPGNPADAQVASFWGEWDLTFTFAYLAAFALLARWLVRLFAPPGARGPAIRAGL